MKIGLNDFLVVTNVLHLHMKNAVMRTKLFTAILEMEDLCSMATSISEVAKKKADQAMEKLNKGEGKSCERIYCSC